MQEKYGSSSKANNEIVNNRVDNHSNSINNDDTNSDSKIPIDSDAIEAAKNNNGPATSIADIIGEYGFYQLSLTILTFFRYTCMAMMTNVGSLLAPQKEFWCQPDNSILNQLNKTTMNDSSYLKNKCQLELINGSVYKCQAWQFNNQSGITLTDSFSLVCDHDWLRSAFQSTISVGVVAASVIWGSFSDRHGRAYTIRVCFFFTLITGIISYLSTNFAIIAVSRSLSSFGDLGLVVSLSTIIVESLGNKYRGATGLIVYTGWSLGVMIMPWVVDYYMNFKSTMLFMAILHLATLPWLLTIGESVRWLLVNGKIEEARMELHRVSRWNLRGDQKSLDDVDRKFDLLKSKFVLVAERRKIQRSIDEAQMGRCKVIFLSLVGGLDKVGEIFQSRGLAATALTLIWTTFNSELLYMFFILINSDIGDNVKLNYAIGGIMELLATIISIYLVSAIARKTTLVLVLTTISSLSLVLAFTHDIASMSIWVLNLTKLAVSTLSSLVYITTTEVYPTNLRQTGFGLSGTLGSIGAVVAPFIRTELTDQIGMTKVMLILVILPLSAATLIPFFLRETQGVELSDDVEELENENGLNEAPMSSKNEAKKRSEIDLHKITDPV